MYQHEIDQRQVVRYHVIVLLDPLYQPERLERLDYESADEVQLGLAEFRDGYFHLVGFRVELREAVPRAGDEVEELRNGVEEVEDLGDEEEEGGFAEVAEDADHGEGHSGEVAERVAHEYFRWIPAKEKQMYKYDSRIAMPVPAQEK